MIAGQAYDPGKSDDVMYDHQFDCKLKSISEGHNTLKEEKEIFLRRIPFFSMQCQASRGFRKCHRCLSDVRQDGSVE